MCLLLNFQRTLYYFSHIQDENKLNTIYKSYIYIYIFDGSNWSKTSDCHCRYIELFSGYNALTL